MKKATKFLKTLYIHCFRSVKHARCWFIIACYLLLFFVKNSMMYKLNILSKWYVVIFCNWRVYYDYDLFPFCETKCLKVVLSKLSCKILDCNFDGYIFLWFVLFEYSIHFDGSYWFLDVSKNKNILIYKKLPIFLINSKY